MTEISELILSNYLKQVELNKPAQSVKPNFSPQQIQAAWEATGKMKKPNFKFDEVSYDIAKMCFAEEFSDRGVLIQGSKGIGKTLNMDIFCTINNNMMKVNTECFEMAEIEQNYKIKGAVFLQHLEQLPCLVINDMGLEKDLNDFGTHMNVFADIIYLRYRMFQKKGFKTHCTTNMGWANIQKKYGERLSDRFKEMFYRIEIKGESKR